MLPLRNELHSAKGVVTEASMSTALIMSCKQSDRNHTVNWKIKFDGLWGERCDPCLK